MGSLAGGERTIFWREVITRRRPQGETGDEVCGDAGERCVGRGDARVS
jgi:hypothetical protein